MKRIYIAGPISRGDLAHNVNQATAAFVALAVAGLAPFCPHWSVYSKPCKRVPITGYESPDVIRTDVVCVATVSGNDEMTHADWLNVDLPWVQVADAVLRLPGESAGADREVEFARACGVPVYHSVREVVDALSVRGV